MYMYMYVYVYVHVNVHVCTCECTCVCICTCMCICSHGNILFRHCWSVISFIRRASTGKGSNSLVVVAVELPIVSEIGRAHSG